MTQRLFGRLLTTFTLALVAVTTAQPAAQRGGQRGDPPPAGPATVDFVALTADGQPVRDLTAAQISLKVGNKDRTITSLELVQFGAAASALPAPFGSNALADVGRTFLLVVDEESLRPGIENTLREALLAFEQALPAGDRLGLFAIPRGATSLSPTADRARFRAAVAGLQGRANASITTSERRCHARDVLTGLSAIMGGINSQGAATPVVLFSVTMVGISSGTAEMGVFDACVLQPSDFQRAGAAADTAHAQFYLVRPEDTAELGNTEGLENLTGLTGGHMLHLGSATDGALHRIAQETSAYYRGTFTADGVERNGASHRMELRVSRPDVSLRTRASLLIPRASPDTTTPQSMLREVTVHRQFGLRVLGIASRNDGDEKHPMKVVALAEATDPAVKFKAAAAGLYDSTGRLIAQWTARPEELQRSPLAAAVPVPVGKYRLRFAAVDTNGRAATADYDVTAETTDAGPARLAGLMIGAVDASGFAPIVQITGEQEVVVVFELYGKPASPFGALVELAATADGPALVEAPPGASATPVADKFLFNATLPVAALKPGDYQVRAKVAFEGAPMGVLTQTIRKQ